MSDQQEAGINGATVAKLARGVRLQRDEVRGRVVLLAPERALALDEVAIKIVEALDGVRTVDQIVDGFVQAYNAPRDQIVGDVTAFLRELADRRMVELSQ
jgi:pyrroloquinoline quinone biosynthesis protein D